MTVRIILAALVAATAAPLAAQVASTASSAEPAPAPKEDLVRVALDTDKGRIVVALDRGRAPVTTANFLAYVDKHWFDGQPFYRAMPYGDGGLIQGGIRDGNKQLKPIAVEPTTTTGLHNVAGAIVMANEGPGTTRTDFFILTTDIPAFDATATDPGYAAFGRVVEGMDVVKAIFAAPRSPTKGDGIMKGQMLEPEVRIVKAARLPD
jgi:peptidyl-prolyl cis-trans isomerase A (cyclophilin A)